MDSVLLGVSKIIVGFYRALDVSGEPPEQFFAPDGIWVRLGQSLQGRDAIRSALESRETGRVSCHLVSNLQARELAPDRAECQYFVTVYEGKAEIPLRLVTILDAHDKLVRLGDEWKLTYKHSRRHLPFAPV